MALSAATITAGIAALSISGVTVKDVSGIPNRVLTRDLPLLFPAPGDWIGAAEGAPDTETTFGTASGRYWQVHRTFKYIYLHSAAGEGRGLADEYSTAATKLELIIAALIALDLAGVDVKHVGHTAVGVLANPTGQNQFNGAEVTITLMERINA